MINNIRNKINANGFIINRFHRGICKLLDSNKYLNNDGTPMKVTKRMNKLPRRKQRGIG
jgi:hypothetical protein